MRPEQWELFKTVAKTRRPGRVPFSLILDSPWIPGYLGIRHVDYYFDPEVWFRANLRIMEEFPEVIVFPSWWVEFGMAIEPSALGCKIRFSPDRPPDQLPMLFRLEDLEDLPTVNPHADGLMAAALQRYASQKQRVFNAGYTIPVVAARGPLCSAAFLRGLTALMLDIVDNPAGVHKLLSFTTDTTINWLRAQAEVIGSSVEGIFLLDDIVGFLSPKDYLEFAHPYLRRVFASFPQDWVKVYHNDANIGPFLECLAEAGFDVLNWTSKLDITEVQKGTCGKICLMGNVPPLEVGTRGTPESAKRAVLELLRKTGSAGIILSLGGGVGPGVPKANIQAMADAVQEFNSR